jgi:hypothetical protein
VASDLGTVAAKLVGEKGGRDRGQIDAASAMSRGSVLTIPYRPSAIRFPPLPAALTDRSSSVIWLTLLRVVFMGTCTPRPEPFVA